MSTHDCRLIACPLGGDRYLVSCPDFPAAAPIKILAPNADEALARAQPWLAGLVLRTSRE